LGLEEADGADDRLSRAVGRGVARLGFCLEKLGTERPEVKP